jgi:hypothetical protein
VSRDDQAVYREIKAVVAFVIDRVAQKDTPGGMRRELMWRSGCHVGVTRTTENAQMLVGRRGTKQGKVRTRNLNRRKTV